MTLNLFHYSPSSSDCLSFSLSQILVDLESLADNMPKIKRCNSEPSSLHYSHIPLVDAYVQQTAEEPNPVNAVTYPNLGTLV